MPSTMLQDVVKKHELNRRENPKEPSQTKNDEQKNLFHERKQRYTGLSSLT